MTRDEKIEALKQLAADFLNTLDRIDERLDIIENKLLTINK